MTVPKIQKDNNTENNNTVVSASLYSKLLLIQKYNLLQSVIKGAGNCYIR